MVNAFRKGIIPARAGFTRPWRACRTAVKDHPRSRGVYPLSCPVLKTEIGSSPLARGLRGVRDRAYPLRRIIPARAGFTSCSPSRSLSRGDHPRSRGVYAVLDLVTVGHLRIIPARAGFT